jgi:16S rRNA (uracil1498-N3)-methyltransferase
MSDHNIFYIPPGFFHSEQVFIEGSHLRHIKNALRKTIGDQVTLTDGQGHHYNAELSHADRRRMTAKILHKKLMPRNYALDITVGFVPVKGLRNDSIIEKSTELGVTGFVAFISEYAVVKNIGKQKIERWNKVAQSAMTQSRQYYLPEVIFAPDIESVLQMGQKYDSMLVADPDGKGEVRRGSRKILLLIGPEGGWSESEKAVFKKEGVTLMSLGSTRLRSETAAIVGVAKIMAAYGQI